MATFGTQIATAVTILDSHIGFHAVSLLNLSDDSEPLIAAGSVVEIASATFQFAADTSINASSWTAIATGSNAFVALTPSGTAGSQIVTPSWTSTAPVFSTSKSGWYLSAGSNVRCIAEAYKNGASSWWRKQVLDKPTNYQTYTRVPLTKVIDLGVWNMDTTTTLSIATGIDPVKIIGLKVGIRIDDPDTSVSDFREITSDSTLADYWQLDITGASTTSTILTIIRGAGGQFDNTNFNDATINRGHVIIWHFQ